MKSNRTLEKFMPYLLMFFMPTYFILMMTVIRRTLVEAWGMGAMKHFIHILLPTYCLVNVVGNMLLSIATDTVSRMPSKDPKSRYCDKCLTFRPAKSWHCVKCDVCILRRDHHCYMLSTCIGTNNVRYFIMYLLHVHISMLYSTYYVYCYLSMKFGKDGMFVSIVRMINPYLRYVIREPWSYKELHVLFLGMNIILIVWSGWCLIYHGRNMLMGVTSYEARGWDWSYAKTHWKRNVVKAFGSRWYWTPVWPLVSSPLQRSVED